MKIRHIVLGTLVLAMAGWPVGSVYSQDDPVASEAPAVYRDLPLSSKGKLQFFVDTASFRSAEGFVLQEIYTLLDAKQLQFVPEGGQYVAQVDLTVRIFDSGGVEAASETWTRNVSVESLKALQETGAPVRDIIGFDLRPGAFRLTVMIEDIYGDKQGTCEAVLGEPAFGSGSMTTSEILFASSLERVEGEGRFVKNGWQVLPNTTRGYRVGNPLYVYFEIYNLKVQADLENDTFVLGYSLADSSGVPVKSYPAKRLVKPGESVVKTDSLDTEGVEGGLYYLQVDAFDRAHREHVRTRRKVYLISDKQKEPEVTEEDKEMLRYFGNIRWVAEERDLKIYEILESRNAKDKFLKAFWKKLDPTPNTPTNERLIQHLQRMRYAETYFASQPRKRGSDTDKGRVYIKYGPPDDTDFNTTAAGQKPVENWAYERQGRYIFVFRDRRGHGVFDLVHSTYPGELYNPTWEQEF